MYMHNHITMNSRAHRMGLFNLSLSGSQAQSSSYIEKKYYKKYMTCYQQ